MRRFAVPLFWVGFALVSTAQTLISMITHGHSPVRIIIFQLCVWSAWVAVTYGIFRLVERVPVVPPRLRNVLIHIFTALIIGVTHAAWWMFLIITMRPYDDMGASTFFPVYPRMLLSTLPLELIFYSGAVAAAHAVSLARRTTELERSLARARTHALELQLQPHFLFNTLNSVCSLVRARQNDEAVELMAGLCDLLRYTLDHAGRQRVPLELETEMLERYLGIQRVRFPDRLDISIDVAPDVRRATVPTLILQPLAENAIRHGIARVASPGRVELRAFRRNGSLEIEMFNTGTLGGERRGIGLTNTAERLKQLYGDAQRFDVSERDGGVVASISIRWGEVA
jgi:hypothetical protein